MSNSVNLDIRADPKGQGRRLFIRVDSEQDVFLSVEALAEQSSLSKRTIRELLKDPANSIPHYKLNGRVLIHWPEFKEWLQSYRVGGTDELSDVLKRKKA